MKKLLEESLKVIKDCELDIELLKRQNELLCKDNNIKIKELTENIEQSELLLETELKKSGEKKLECKMGYSSYMKMPDKWEYGEETINDIHVVYPEDEEKYIKVTETLIKTNIKKDVLSGKIGLPHLTVTPQDPKFSYKIKR